MENLQIPNHLSTVAKSQRSVVVGPQREFFSGEAGGKWAGTRFFHSLLEENKGRLAEKFNGRVKFACPATSVLRSGCFEDFLQENRLYNFFETERNDAEILSRFLAADFNSAQKQAFLEILDAQRQPLIVRSSALGEDAERASFAGSYYSVFISNIGTKGQRLEQLEAAIKLVYASAFLENAREFARRNNVLIGAQKMAIMVQDVVGSQWQAREGGQYFSPQASFAAYSFNDFAPIGVDPNHGFMRVALGLGPGVLDGHERMALRVNLGKPYPITGLYNISDYDRYSPTHFFALGLDGGIPDSENGLLRRLSFAIAPEGMMENYVSYYSADNDIMRDTDLMGAMEPLVSFKNIVNRRLPFVDAVRELKQILEDAFGMLVDFEGAFDTVGTGATSIIHCLQARAQVRRKDGRLDNLPDVSAEMQILNANNSIGKGKYEISTVIYVPHSEFSHASASVLSNEILMINREMVAQRKQYALFVPGRFGTQDKSTGIPGTFATISNASAIVEQVDGQNNLPSQGTHLFEDIVGAGIAYLHHNGNRQFNPALLERYASSIRSVGSILIYEFEQPLKLVLDKGGNCLLFAGSEAWSN